MIVRRLNSATLDPSPRGTGSPTFPKSPAGSNFFGSADTTVARSMRVGPPNLSNMTSTGGTGNARSAEPAGSSGLRGGDQTKTHFNRRRVASSSRAFCWKNAWVG